MDIQRITTLRLMLEQERKNQENLLARNKLCTPEIIRADATIKKLQEEISQMCGEVTRITHDGTALPLLVCCCFSLHFSRFVVSLVVYKFFFSQIRRHTFKLSLFARFRMHRMSGLFLSVPFGRRQSARLAKRQPQIVECLLIWADPELARGPPQRWIARAPSCHPQLAKDSSITQNSPKIITFVLVVAHTNTTTNLTTSNSNTISCHSIIHHSCGPPGVDLCAAVHSVSSTFSSLWSPLTS